MTSSNSTGVCPVPHVNNAQSSVTDTPTAKTATYTCLTGFRLTGSGQIACNKSVGTWPSAPTCDVISDPTNVNVYNYVGSEDDLWYYVLAALVGLLLLLLLAALLWCCCCVDRAWRSASSIHPAVTGVMTSRPLHTESSAVSKSGRRSHCCWCCRRKDSGGRIFLVSESGASAGINSRKQNGSRELAKQNGSRELTKASQPGKISHSSAHTHSSAPPPVSPVQVEITGSGDESPSPREAAIYRRVKPAKVFAVQKMWMPHKNTIRNINTSTK